MTHVNVTRDCRLGTGFPLIAGMCSLYHIPTISPKYCDVILRRFTAETGLEPVLLTAFNEPHITQDMT